MNKVKRGKKVRAVSVGVGILAFLLAFCAGAVSKFAIQPGWAKEYSVKWSDELGTLKEDLPYGDGDANKFDLYLPKLEFFFFHFTFLTFPIRFRLSVHRQPFLVVCKRFRYEPRVKHCEIY